MNDCMKQQECSLNVISNVMENLLEGASNHAIVQKNANNLDEKAEKTVNTCNMSLISSCYKLHSHNSSQEDLVKKKPSCPYEEHSEKLLPIKENVHALVSSMLDVINAVTSLVKKVEFYCLSQDFGKRNEPADRQFSPKFLSQAYEQDAFSHMISCTYPTTIVSLPFNFSREPICNSTSAFCGEFQLPISNSGVPSNETSSKKIPLTSVCIQQNCDFNFRSLLCHCTMSQLNNSVNSEEVKAKREENFNDIYLAREETVAAHLEEKPAECFYDKADKLADKVISCEPITGNNSNSHDKSLKLVNVGQSYLSFQNKTVNQCVQSLPSWNGSDLIGRNIAFETRVSPASKRLIDNDVEMCDEIIDCSLPANICDSVELCSTVELFNSTSTRKVDATRSFEKSCPTAVDDFFQTSYCSRKCEFKNDESHVNLVVEIDSQSNANYFYTSTPIDRDIVNFELTQSNDLCDSKSVKITEASCFDLTLNNEVNTVKHDSLWFKFVNNASLKTRKVASVTKASDKLLENKKGVNTKSRCIKELFAEEEYSDEIFSYSNDLSDTTEDLNKAFLHTSSEINTQEILNESVFKSNRLMIGPELQNATNSQCNTKLVKFCPHKRKITNSVENSEVASVEKVVINTTSGQLLMRYVPNTIFGEKNCQNFLQPLDFLKLSCICHFLDVVSSSSKGINPLNTGQIFQFDHESYTIIQFGHKIITNVIKVHLV